MEPLKKYSNWRTHRREPQFAGVFVHLLARDWSLGRA
jgi:hypothetical protein